MSQGPIWSLSTVSLLVAALLTGQAHAADQPTQAKIAEQKAEA